MKRNPKKYRLVILGHEWDLYRLAYSEAVHGRRIYMGEREPKGKILRFLYKVHFTEKINRFVKLPFKGLWCRYWFRKLDKNEPTVFLIFKKWLDMNASTGLIEHIKRHFRDNKVVFFFQDIVSSYSGGANGGAVRLDYLHEKTDLLISYDKADCQEYGMEFHPTVFSHVDIPKNNKPRSDVFFIGKDKGRQQLLGQIYDKLTATGFNCLFILLDVPERERMYKGKIRYIDRELPYAETLEYVECADCLLELMQPGAVGSTYRMLEAISFNKMLLTNNAAMLESEYFSPEYVSIFNSPDDIDIKFLRAACSGMASKNRFHDKIGPERLVSFIEEKLNIEVE
ncbi:MAG: hypothetical protein NC204_00345 [Candidatus Amulumruptor caecigallinarius]|nr:hypothetical protein [Candidatus Amulumruptor caecigallinarius]